MIFKLLSKTGDDGSAQDPSSDGVEVDGETGIDGQKLSPAMRERLEQLEEMRGAISGFAESGSGGPTRNGHIRRLGHLNALLCRMESETRKIADLELELEAARAENARLKEQAADADETLNAGSELAVSLRSQLNDTRRGLSAATAEIDTLTRNQMLLEAKIKAGQERLASQQDTIDTLHQDLEAERAERVLAKRASEKQRQEVLEAKQRMIAEANNCKRLETRLETANEKADEKAALIKKLNAEIKSLKLQAGRIENAHKLEQENLQGEITRANKNLAASQKAVVAIEKTCERQRVKLTEQATKIKGLQAANKRLLADQSSAGRSGKSAKAASAKSSKPASKAKRPKQ